MHFAFISTTFLLAISEVSLHPAPPLAAEPRQLFSLFSQTTPIPEVSPNRPLQKFFKRILNALRPATTVKPLRGTTVRDRTPPPLSYLEDYEEAHEIPNFVDFSTFLLDSYAANNSAIKFTYMQPNFTTSQELRGNYSVISFLVPHDKIHRGKDNANSSSPGMFGFLSSLRLPWSREPTNTVYSQFPPFIEHFTQRIQAYFSIYKYSDDSRTNNTIVVLADEEVSGNQNDDVDYELSPTTESSTEGLKTSSDNRLETTNSSDLHDDRTTGFVDEMKW